MTVKIARPISSAVMRPLGSIPTRPLRVSSDWDTPPETEGKSCARFPCILAQNWAALLLGRNECKQSLYEIQVGELFVTKVDNQIFYWGSEHGQPSRSRER